MLATTTTNSTATYIETFTEAREEFLNNVARRTTLDQQQTDAYYYIDKLVEIYQKYHLEVPNLHDTLFREAMDITNHYDLDVVIISKKCGGCH